MTIRLPDVNLLVALAWPSHVHHRAAQEWFAVSGKTGWATCPFTQAGFIRVSSNPKIIREAVSPREAIKLLTEMSRLGSHNFWPDELDFVSDVEIPTSLLMGHRQVTDAYLVGLAVRRNGILATFDRSVTDLIPARSGHRSHVELVTP